MLRKVILVVIFILGMTGLAVAPAQDSGLWPAQKPYQTGFLQVSGLHSIYYQLGGNPQGKPVMVLHGGPGAGCTPYYFRFFNPEKYNIILHDQRGCGRSRPPAELRENTTSALVEDIEKLRRHLNLGKVILFGGSWGSTLALAYAEAYPQQVRGMVIRGVFTATREEIDHYYGGGTAKFFPENYETFLSQLITDPKQGDYPAQIVDKLKTKDAAARLACAKAWVRYEYKIAMLDYPQAAIEQTLSEPAPYFTFAILENHYMANRCFLEEGQLLREAKKLADIPMTIVNGRYDMICPPLTAYRLHKLLPQSRLVIVESAGHSATEPGIQAALLRAMREFEDRP
jgi:proline iminopeptidase